MWSSPAAVVADNDAVQASDGENTEGQDHDDNVKHFELWVEEEKNTGGSLRANIATSFIQLDFMMTAQWHQSNETDIKSPTHQTELSSSPGHVDPTLPSRSGGGCPPLLLGPAGLHSCCCHGLP